MALNKFSKGEAIRFGWNTATNNLGFFGAVLVVAGLINVVPDLILEPINDVSAFLLLSIPFWILQAIVSLGIIKISLKFADNETPEFDDLFSSYPLFLKYAIASIIYGVAVTIGMFLLIVPGIYLAIKYGFYGYFIVDKGVGPFEASRRSAEITKGVKWNLFVFGLILVGINVLGLIALVIGLFATVPTGMVATAFVYRKLLAQGV